MRSIGWLAGATLLTAALLLTPGLVVAAKGPPPVRADLLGTWTVSFKGTSIDTNTGTSSKISETATWTVIADTDPDRVVIQNFGSGLGEDYLAGYVAASGMLFIAAHLDQTRAGFAVVTGTTGKLKIKGAFGLRDDGVDHRVELTTFSGTWTAPLTSAKPGSAAARAVSPAATAKPPPSASDLDGAMFATKLSLKGFGLEDGEKGGRTEVAIWTLTDLGAGNVNIHSTGDQGADDTPARFVNGFLYVGMGDSPGLGTQAVVAAVRVSGTPGKLKIKGGGVEVRNDPEDNFGAVLVISAAQTPNP